MISLKNILGFTVLIGAFVAVSITILAPAQIFVIYGLLAFTALAAIAWLFLQRRQVLVFLTKKSTRSGVNVAFAIFLVLGILTFVNVLGKQFSWRKDMTRTGVNSLSPQSIKVVREFPQELKAYYFNGALERERHEPLLKNYARESKLFQYEFVDTAKRPTLTQSMEVKRNDTLVLQIVSSNKRVKVEGLTEEKVTNALIKLQRSKDQVVYFTSGHGERALSGDDPLSYTALRGEIEKQGYSVKELSLMSEGKVPADAAAVVVAGPKTAFFPKELEVLSAWLAAGGRAAFAFDLDVVETGLTKGSRQLAALLSAYGVSVRQEMLVDPTSRSANLEPQILLGFVGSRTHPITKDFPSSTLGMVPNFFFPLTTYLTHEKREGTQVEPLVQTSQMAWAESDWNSLKSGLVKLDKTKDHQGVMNLAYAVEQAVKEKSPTRLAVFATSTFATNSLLDKSSNRDFFLNSLAWLTNDENLISIRARDEAEGEKIEANANVMGFIMLLTVFLLPLTIVIGGVYIWWRRSKQ
jgi:ABC-type uncharacterized transport system involved in gliding motility auxiliary subunit